MPYTQNLWPSLKIKLLRRIFVFVITETWLGPGRRTIQGIFVQYFIVIPIRPWAVRSSDFEINPAPDYCLNSSYYYRWQRYRLLAQMLNTINTRLLKIGNALQFDVSHRVLGSDLEPFKITQYRHKVSYFH